MKFKIMILVLGLLLVGSMMAQDLPVVYVYPFEMRGNQSPSLNQRLYSYFCSSLSATDRIRLFSQEAWKRIIQTERLILTINDVRNTEQAIKLGKLTPVDYVVTGRIDLQKSDVHFYVEWINLHNGLIEKTTSHKINITQDLQKLVELVMRDLMPFVVKEGKVLSQNPDHTVLIKAPPLAGWLVGDEFVLVNNLKYGYGRVRLMRFDGREAQAEIIYLNDRITPGDRVVFSKYFENKKIQLLPAYLADFTGNAVSSSVRALQLICRQILLESGKFYVIERPISDPYFEFRFSFNQPMEGQLRLINLSIIEYPQNKVVYEKNLECVPEDVKDGVKALLAQALNRWEKKALVSRVSETEIMINKGSNEQIRKGQKILFKSEEDGGVIAESEIAEVFPTESRISLPEKPVKIRTGMIVAFVDGDFSEGAVLQRLQSIHQNAQRAKQLYRQEVKQQKEQKQREKEKAKIRSMPKSRIRVGYSRSIEKNSSEKGFYDFKKSPKMDLDIYLGSYPYFNVVLNYEYQHLQFMRSMDKVFINTIGIGVKLQSPVIGRFSLYGIGLYQYSFFDKNGSETSNYFARDQWKNQYMTIRAGLDFKLDAGFGIYLEAGEKRILKYEVLKLQYYAATAGISLWF